MRINIGHTMLLIQLNDVEFMMKFMVKGAIAGGDGGGRMNKQNCIIYWHNSEYGLNTFEIEISIES